MAAAYFSHRKIQNWAEIKYICKVNVEHLTKDTLYSTYFIGKAEDSLPVVCLYPSVAAWLGADANMNQISVVSCLSLSAPALIGFDEQPPSILHSPGPGHSNCILCFPLWLDPRHFLNSFLSPLCCCWCWDISVLSLAAVVWRIYKS